MRRNTKKFKPNPSSSLRHSVRSSSIRDIIGDRRFNGQFRRVNTHGTEGIEKIKRTKVKDTEADDLPNLGQNASSNQSETAENPRRCSGDLAAKTSEYAFFKRMKETTSSNIHVHQKYHENQLKNSQLSDHFTREEIPTVQKESFKDARFSLPVEIKQDDAQYSFLSPPHCGSKNSKINNVVGLEGTSVQKVTLHEYDWSSPSGSKTKTSGNTRIFSMKREKLRRLVADKSLYNVKEVSSKGFDLVSALISRILPENQENNCRDETETKYKLRSSSESETALIKGHEANKRKFMESHHISYLNDGFPRSSERRFVDMDLLGSESCFIEYDYCHPEEAYKRKLMESEYMEDDFPRSSSERLLEWESNNTIQYDYFHPEEAYTRKLIPRSLEWDPTKSSIRYNNWHTENGSEISNFGYESGYFKPKLVESSQPLLLGWEEKSEKDEYRFSGPPLSCCSDQFLESSIIPYTPEEHFISNYNQKEEESFDFLDQSPANDLLHHVLHSSDEKEKEKNFFMCNSPDDFSDCWLKNYNSSSGYVKGFKDKYYDEHIGYPLLLHDIIDDES